MRKGLILPYTPYYFLDCVWLEINRDSNNTINIYTGYIHSLYLYKPIFFSISINIIAESGAYKSN